MRVRALAVLFWLEVYQWQRWAVLGCWALPPCFPARPTCQARRQTVSNLRVTDAEIKGTTNKPDQIHVEEYKTHDYYVFAVHYDGQQWKRLRPNRGGHAPFWVKRNE